MFESDVGRRSPEFIRSPMKWTQIITTAHLRQFVSHAIVAGFLNPLSLTTLNCVLQSLSPQHSILFYRVLRRQGISPDNFTLPFILQAVCRLRCRRKTRAIQAESFKLGFQSNVFVQNSLLSAYFQCGLVSDGRRVFDFMKEEGIVDVISWNSVMSGYLQNDHCEECLEMMRNCREISDSVTFVNGLVGCGRTRRVELGRQIHGRVISNGLFGRDFYLGSSLIDMYVKFGLVDDARRSFDEMTVRNVVVCTSMISGYTYADMFVEALEFFRLMQAQGLNADDTMIACVISACAHLGALDLGRWVHSYCKSSSTGGLTNSIKVKSALVDMYSKCGDVETALSIFHESVSHGDVYLWTAMICGLAMNGRADEALCLFSEMEMSRAVVPNEITFLGVLSACCHGGLVDRGFHYLHRMVQNYDLKPRIQHFGCIVDLLGRAKLVREAEEFINKMPLKPDVVIWRSLLFAFRRNGDVEKAEQVAKTIMELEPRKGEVHVMLSNVYASASKWTDANIVRRKMKESGFHKQPGCSFIEVDGVVHEFLVGDVLHSQTELIHDTLLRLKDHVFSQGHFPNVEEHT